MKILRALLACALVCALALPAAPRAAAAAPSFGDVPASHWAAESISRAAAAGLVRGVTSTRFGLGRPMTRAACAAVVCRLFGWETVTPETGSFTDNRDSSAWYYGAVETALAHGAVTKQSDRFRPGDAVTREELAVMLVRALGYTTIAGLEQGLPCPFSDADSNAGYLTMACALGIAGGDNGKFAPDARATREQAVVMIMRVRDALNRPAPETEAVLSDGESLPGLPGCAAAAVPAAALAGGRVVPRLSDDAADALCRRTRDAGAKALLGVTGTGSALGSGVRRTAGAIAAAADGYDGVLLDVTGLTASQTTRYAALSAALRETLGDKLLYVTAEAPAPGAPADSTHWTSLAAAADRLILRVNGGMRTVDGFPVAPPEPLENVYYALAALEDIGVSGEKLSLWLTATGSVWYGVSARSAMSADEIAALLAQPGADAHFSLRYGASYLTAADGRTTVWYHDARSAAALTRLLDFFGCAGVCLSDAASVADYPGGSLLDGLDA